MFEFISTQLKDLILVNPKYTDDHRGYMTKHFERQIFLDNGIDFHCYEIMESSSVKGVLRGLHLQKNHPQAKLVRVVLGEIFDVAVDLRESSPTFGKWQGFYLSAQNRQVLYLPRGFAHGFLVLSDHAIFSYQCDAAYRPDDEHGVLWNDRDLGVAWPLEKGCEVILSEKDRQQKTFHAQYGGK